MFIMDGSRDLKSALGESFVENPERGELETVNSSHSISKEMWEIFVPCMSNEGKPFRTRHHKEWDKQVRKISHGLTILKPAKGQWINPSDDKLYEERMIPVRVVCTKKQIIQIMKLVQKHYNQIDVLAYKISNDVLFLSEINN